MSDFLEKKEFFLKIMIKKSVLSFEDKGKLLFFPLAKVKLESNEKKGFIFNGMGLSLVNRLCIAYTTSAKESGQPVYGKGSHGKVQQVDDMVN